MAKKTARIPIMSDDDEKFMAFSGLVQWTQGVIEQSRNLSFADKKSVDYRLNSNFIALMYSRLCQEHYFVISANKLIEHRAWIEKFGPCGNVDFSEIDSFPSKVVKDLRDMREHAIDYFKGEGREKNRWVVENPPIYSADASSRIGNLLGGRLDYVKFSEAAERLLSQLLREPIPYPKDE